MTAPKVSVVISNYNYGRFIGETLQSILNQTYKDYEVIVVDDGSTDNSVEIVDSFVKQFPDKIFLMRGPNRGVSSARNTALSHCRGQLIAFLDSDDLWHEDFLKTVTNFLEENQGCMAVYTNAELFESATGKMLSNWFSPQSNRKPFSGQCADKLYVRGNFIPIVTAVVRRGVIDSIGPFNAYYRVGEDWDFWLRVTSRFEIHYLDHVLCKIRRHGTNISFGPLNYYNQLRIFRNILRWNPELRAKIDKKDFDRAWYLAYYEVGRALTLRGKRRLARRFFRKALLTHNNILHARVWLYYPLTFFPGAGLFRGKWRQLTTK